MPPEIAGAPAYAGLRGSASSFGTTEPLPLAVSICANEGSDAASEIAARFMTTAPSPSNSRCNSLAKASNTSAGSSDSRSRLGAIAALTRSA